VRAQRKVYLLTNGQVPYWLDTSHPRLVLVTHADIFANKSHLPTFSSPAIEANLHRIPGLSSNFLYLNDDTMFGAPVWPSDFITPSHGQKVFLGWSVPNCNEGCPPNWIGDGYCDVQCNVSSCDWDANDCINATSSQWTANAQHWYVLFFFPCPISHHRAYLCRYQGGAAGAGAGAGFGNMANYCSRGCPSSWIGDKYCDRACKVVECGMDAGDCGLEVLVESVHGAVVESGQTELSLPVGVPAFFLNLTNMVGEGRITDGTHDKDDMVRTATISQQHKVMIITLHKNSSRIPVQVVLHWEDEGGAKHNATLTLIVGGEASEATTTGAIPSSSPAPKEEHLPITAPSSAIVDETTVGLAQEEAVQARRNEDGPAEVAGRQLLSLGRKVALDASLLHPMGTGELLGSEDFPWLRSPKPSYEARHLNDVYGDSLKFVNSLYNRHFSTEARKVPAHMGHFLQLPVLERLIKAFPQQWDSTSSHPFRASNDMQFAFAYFYFLINERQQWDWPALFARLDSDGSNHLDENEWRTLWLILHEPPLDEGKMVDKWNAISENGTVAMTRERLADSPDLYAQLQKAISSKARNPTDIKDTDEVGFVMVRNNDSSLVERLDGIRRKRHKHICLNDNLHHDSPDTPKVKETVLRFYQALLPKRCSFELETQPRRTANLGLWSGIILSILALCFMAAFVAKMRKRKTT
jgi:hypothetical protein